jgi:catechol 2,3-dioxygenase-like lactoylglutathione lyase family enzyme
VNGDLERVVFRDIDHVQLAMPAGGEALAEAFYQDVLGFTRIRKPAHLEARGGCWFRFNDVQVHLGVDDHFAPARKAHPAFLISSAAALQRQLQAAGVAVVWDTPLEGYQRFYASDPFGNRLEFMERIG